MREANATCLRQGLLSRGVGDDDDVTSVTSLASSLQVRYHRRRHAACLHHQARWWCNDDDSHVRPYIRQWVSCLHTTSVTECLLTPYQCSIAILHLSLSVRRNPTCANECPFATLHAPMNVPSPHYIRHWVSRRFTQILTYFVRICQMLPMFGRCFQTARFARFLRTLTAFSRYFLAHIFLEFGRLWQFWHMLPDFARFWQILTDFHRFW